MYRSLLVIAVTLLCACTATRHIDGWYPVSDSDHIEGKVIASVADFEAVVLDTTSIPGVAFIDGRLKPALISKWTDATEQRIGKRIGFVYNDSVITAPTVHCRIESGSFTINSNDRHLILKIYHSITD